MQGNQKAGQLIKASSHRLVGWLMLAGIVPFAGWAIAPYPSLAQTPVQAPIPTQTSPTHRPDSRLLLAPSHSNSSARQKILSIGPTLCSLLLSAR